MEVLLDEPGLEELNELRSSLSFSSSIRFSTADFAIFSTSALIPTSSTRSIASDTRVSESNPTDIHTQCNLLDVH
ncbi:hypothetical protein ZOSMA_27G01400 [Zostera marina]|uniref:Uncharacterized protein n=1 Tax=Zostera marina TaxID=29655 RepID=A0A0K9PFT7_ZOSMR|nr:hypothetical protein ZOSMA_27G01400 [Zostera marina]